MAPKQTDFSGGEVSPLLYGRTDLALFGKALRSARNFFVSKLGAAVSRPGTTFVAEVQTPDPTGVVFPRRFGPPDAINRVRLVDFNVSDTESFVLMFGHLYVRFFTQGGEVLAGGVPYQVATAFTYADLPRLKWAQIGEVLTLTCPGRNPQELRHVSDAPPAWTLTDAVTAPLQPFFRDVDSLTPTVGFTLVDGSGTPDAALPTPDTDHPAREWQWQCTMLCREKATGRLFETLPELVSERYNGNNYDASVHPLTSDLWALARDQHIVLRRPETNGLLSQPDGFDTYDVVAFNIYRGRGTLFGLIGQTTSREFVDVGDEPNYGEQPPLGTDPFGTEVSGLHPDCPAAVAYFEQRRVFAGLTRREADVLASKTGDFDNFDERKRVHVAGESLTITLAARRRGAVRHLVPMERLITLTSSAAFHGGGNLGSPLDFDSEYFPLIEEVGAAEVRPLVVSGACLFVRSMGAGVRALVPGGGEMGGFQGVDLTAFAEHLFQGPNNAVVDWAYAHHPWGVIWAVRGDGVMLSLTTVREREVIAWARHDTDGLVESVCAVPEGDEDAVYIVVKRTIAGVAHRYLERMTSRIRRGGAVLEQSIVVTPPDNICVDCAFQYVGPPVATFTGLEHLEGKDVYVVAQGQPVWGPERVTGGEITLSAQLPANVGAKLVAYVGLLFTPELELLDIAGSDARLKNKQVTHVGFEVDQSKGVAVGQSFDKPLSKQPARAVVDSYGTAPPKTGLFLVPVAGTWDLSARAVLRQTLPLPVTVVGITRKVVGGDDP